MKEELFTKEQYYLGKQVPLVTVYHNNMVNDSIYLKSH